MIALLLGNWRLVGLTLAALTVVAAAYGWLHQHDKGVRAPLEAEIRLLKDEKKANEKRAAEMIAAREKENADLAEKWRNYARQSDDSYEQKIASLRSPNSSGLRLYTGCGNGSELAGSSKTASAGTPEKPAPEPRTGDAAPEVVFGLAEIGQVLQWYAYGQSCHAFVNAK